MRNYPHNNNYRVTKNGEVWSIRNYQYLSQFKDRNGYKRVALYTNGNRIQKFVHILVLETYYCDCPDNMESRHIDGDNQNNSLQNLEWCTPSVNRLDTWEHSKRNGMKIGNSKLGQEDIRLIRYLHSKDFSKRFLSKRFSVHRSTISKIVNRKTWEWIL